MQCDLFKATVVDKTKNTKNAPEVLKLNGSCTIMKYLKDLTLKVAKNSKCCIFACCEYIHGVSVTKKGDYCCWMLYACACPHVCVCVCMHVSQVCSE